MRQTLPFIILLFISRQTQAQSDSLHVTDTLLLHEHAVKAYFNDPLLKNATSSIALIDSTVLQYQQNISLVPAMNSVAGVRMEERSPGSYRLSIRGSLLRSPFGVRNVKIYIDEFAFTDAGGNSYLNLLDMYFIRRVEILKGPDGSLYGANSGGVVRFRSLSADSSEMRVRISGGSYGYYAVQSDFTVRLRKHTLNAGIAAQNSDGYRKQSHFYRSYYQLSDKWQYSRKAELRLLLLISGLEYGTPGGLTKTQSEADPLQARPSTAFTRSAAEQKASVYNRTLFAGVLNDWRIGARTRHVLAYFGSNTDFDNPFITNYEQRQEKSRGFRTFIEHSRKLNSSVKAQGTLGIESQNSYYNISNFGNAYGKRDTLQSWDKISVGQSNFFSRLLLTLKNKLVLELALSYNLQNYAFENYYPFVSEEEKTAMKAVFMPKAALSWQLIPELALRTTASKGYSPPTVSEIRSSDQKINRTLRAESGWNYETGLRLGDQKGFFWWDISAFFFRLDDAIVRQLDSTGNEYFVNAGSTEQPGIESQISFKLVDKKSGFFRLLELRNASSIYKFRFGTYGVFSGNKLTGVPAEVLVSSLRLAVAGEFSLFIQHNYSSRLPLNDANSEYADACQLVQIKLGKDWRRGRQIYSLNFGVDNLLDERYSLGNDLNAFGGRYYNAAPPRNYYVSAGLRL